MYATAVVHAAWRHGEVGKRDVGINCSNGLFLQYTPGTALSPSGLSVSGAWWVARRLSLLVSTVRSHVLAAEASTNLAIEHLARCAREQGSFCTMANSEAMHSTSEG